MKAQPQLLRALIVADSDEEALLLVEALRRGGYEPEWQRVESEVALRDALDAREWDVVFCDYAMPKLDAANALRVLREKGDTLTAIVVSGHVGVEVAVEAMRLGANDFILKSNLERVGPGVEREIGAARLRRERRAAAQALSQSEERYRVLFDKGPWPMWVYDPITLAYLAVNDVAVHQYGYGREEYHGMTLKDLRPAEDVPALLASLAGMKTPADEMPQITKRHRKKDGGVIVVEIIDQPIIFDGQAARVVQAIDMTSRWETEVALQESEERFRGTFEHAGVGIAHVSTNGHFLRVNAKLCEIVGYGREDLLGMTFGELTLLENRAAGEEARQAILAGERTSYHSEKRCLRKNGEVMWVDLSTTLQRSASGDPNYFISVFEDITERKEAEELLRESERAQRDIAAQLETERARLVDAQAVAKVGSWETNLSTGALIWSAETYRIFEISPDRLSLTRHDFMQLVHPEDQAAVHEAFFPSLDGRSLSAIQHRVLMPDNRLKIVEERWRVVLDGQGNPVRAIGTCQDITEQRKADEALRVSEESFRQLAENSGDLLWMVDPSTSRMLYVSPAYERIWGRTCESAYAESTTVFDAIHPEDRARVFEAFSLAGGGRSDLIYRIVRPDGTPRWVHDRAYPVKNKAGEIYRIAGIATDITERRLAEAQIMEQATLLDEARDAICVNDLHQRILYWNTSAQRLYGWTASEALGRNANELLGQGSVALAALKTLIQCGEWHGELQQTTRQGRQLVVESRWSLVREAGGAPKSILIINTDITEAKRAQKQILEQAALLDHARDAILVQDLDGRIQYWNKSAERVFGWTAKEAVGRKIQDLLYENPGAYFTSLKVALHRGDWTGEVTKRTKDGHDILIEGHWTLMRDEAGQPKGILAINTDISEKKNIEAQFFRAQRMESIGTLAGGIAHDLNNVLGPIIMAIDLLKLRMTDPQDLELLDLMEQSGERGVDMVKQVLYFARGVDGHRVLISPARLVGELKRFICDTFPKSISYEADVPHETWNVSGDRTQLHQVLLNLCVNARDAMPRGGRLRITTRNLLIEDHTAAMHPGAHPASYVVLEVADTGEGMSPETVARIFEPFFSTKEIGKGTGLGLSTTHGIVKSHGGFITVDTEPGRGTTFRIHLPAACGPAEAQDEGSAPEYPRGRGETILIIDDEASIRSITGQALETFGYQVMSGEHGGEGIAIYAEHAGEIAAVLTDMVMPSMDGATTIRGLQRINSQVKIIATSGGGTKDAAADATQAGVKYFLAKPYAAETLLCTLDELLHTPA